MKRVVGLNGAVLLGLGSIVGTGVFVSLGLAAGIAGASMVLALFVAGFLATCNGLSSAQLAAAHPVSGGTYEYGYQYLNPWLGFFAGWLFVCAKSASAATAAIGFGGYFLEYFDLSFAAWQTGLVAVVALTLVTATGLKRSNFANTVIVSITLFTLIFFAAVSAPHFQVQNLEPFFKQEQAAMHFLEACALMFVAYTGYGRIATLGEEIKDPRQNIPKAIILTLAISFVLYMATGLLATGVKGADFFYQATINQAAPLETLTLETTGSWAAAIVALGAITAMLGVLLNLLLGISRVVYAMGKRKDVPGFLGANTPSGNPLAAVIFVGIVIFLLVFLKDVKATWSFSAFTVLLYYAITNLAALKLPPEQRLYPRLFSWLGLAGCLGLSAFVNFDALALGVGLLFIGLLWRLGYRALSY